VRKAQKVIGRENQTTKTLRRKSLWHQRPEDESIASRDGGVVGTKVRSRDYLGLGSIDGEILSGILFHERKSKQ
jgi:hypothetical protein